VSGVILGVITGVGGSMTEMAPLGFVFSLPKTVRQFSKRKAWYGNKRHASIRNH